MLKMHVPDQDAECCQYSRNFSPTLSSHYCPKRSHCSNPVTTEWFYFGNSYKWNHKIFILSGLVSFAQHRKIHNIVTYSSSSYLLHKCTRIYSFHGWCVLVVFPFGGLTNKAVYKHSRVCLLVDICIHSIWHITKSRNTKVQYSQTIFWCGYSVLHSLPHYMRISFAPNFWQFVALSFFLVMFIEMQ